MQQNISMEQFIILGTSRYRGKAPKIHLINSEKNKIHFITKSKTKKFKLKYKNEVAKDILHEIYKL